MWDRRGYSRRPIHAIAMSSTHRYQIDTASHLAGDAAFLRRWRVLLEQSAGPERIFQSPEFFDYMLAAGDEGAGLYSITERDSGVIVGIVPVRLRRHSLDFAVGRRRYASVPLRCVMLLGSVPLLPADPALLDQLLQFLLAHYPRCQAVASPAMPADSALWRSVSGSALLAGRFRRLSGAVRRQAALQSGAPGAAVARTWPRSPGTALHRASRATRAPGRRAGQTDDAAAPPPAAVRRHAAGIRPARAAAMPRAGMRGPALRADAGPAPRRHAVSAQSVPRRRARPPVGRHRAAASGDRTFVPTSFPPHRIRLRRAGPPPFLLQRHRTARPAAGAAADSEESPDLPPAPRPDLRPRMGQTARPR